MIYKDFQDSLPTFIRKPQGLTWAGRHYTQGKEFPWKTLSVSFDQARVMFYNDLIYHNAELAAETKVGDGLDALTLDELKVIVDNINTKVKAVCGDNKAKYNTHKCKQSTIVDKQRGLIRSWRRNFGEIENT